MPLQLISSFWKSKDRTVMNLNILQQILYCGDGGLIFNFYRLPTQAAAASPQQRKARTPASKNRNVKNKQPVRMNNRTNAFMPNASLEEQHYEEQKSNIVKQNMQQQFQNQMSQRQQQINRPPPVQESHNQYLIQPRPRDSKPQIQRPLPQFLHSSQIQNIIGESGVERVKGLFSCLILVCLDSTPKSEEFSDSIRMLVLLDNGEQRLITFTLPKEACTIQEILEQVGVPFTKETPIQVSEANANGLNYIVAVGNFPGFCLDVQVSFTPSGERFSLQRCDFLLISKPKRIILLTRTSSLSSNNYLLNKNTNLLRNHLKQRQRHLLRILQKSCHRK